MKKHLVAVPIVLTVPLLAPAFASTVLELGWRDLIPVMEFDDPFKKLTEEQVYHLRTIVRVRQLQKMGRDSGEASARELEAAVDALTKEGIDFESLLSRRPEIRKLRQKASEAVVEDLDSKTVSLGGFILPLEFSGTKATEFLLVPWVGACIHTPPPPPNQIVHVKMGENEAWESKGLFAPVKVTGRMSTKATKQNLFLVDGSADINIGYFMQASTVKEYSKED